MNSGLSLHSFPPATIWFNISSSSFAIYLLIPSPAPKRDPASPFRPISIYQRSKNRQGEFLEAFKTLSSNKAKQRWRVWVNCKKKKKNWKDGVGVYLKNREKYRGLMDFICFLLYPASVVRHQETTRRKPKNTFNKWIYKIKKRLGKCKI